MLSLGNRHGGVLCRALGGRFRRAVALALASLCAMLATQARAQQDASDRADPAEIERRIEQIEPEMRPAHPGPRLPPGPSANAEVQAGPALAFVLTAVRIEGATALKAADFAPLYAEFLAQRVTRAEIEEIAIHITRKLHESGYVLSRAIVPPQRVQAGILRVRVIEGYIESIAFAGADSQEVLLQSHGRPIVTERPLTLSTLERTLLSINALPGLTVRGSAAEPVGRDGAYRLEVAVAYSTFEVVSYLDNRGTPEVGRLQALFRGAVNSPTGFGERLALVFSTVPDQPKELIYLRAEYDQPLGSSDTLLQARVVRSWIDAGADLAEEKVEGRGLQISLHLRQAVLRRMQQSLVLDAGFDFSDSEQESFGQTEFEDRLRVARMGFEWTVGDGWNGTSSIGVELSRGLNIVGASDEGDEELSRADGDGSFTKVTAAVARVQPLWGAFSLRLTGSGQKAFDPLLSSEEFDLGGQRIGRAYDFGEVFGEDGLGGSSELRYDLRFEDAWSGRLQIYGFADGGWAWDHESGGGHGRRSLASAGGGLRISLAEQFNLTFEAAKPLARRVDSTGDRDLRYFFSISAAF